MKKSLFSIVSVLSCLVLCFFLLAVQCSGVAEGANTYTAYASNGTPQGISKESIDVMEKIQTANREVAATILPSVVTIDVVQTTTVNDQGGLFPWFFFNDNSGDGSREYKTEGLGSGFIVRKVGKTYYAMTNQHVTGSSGEITIILNSGDKVPGKLVGADERKDIALVSFDYDEELPVVKLGDSSTVRVGDSVFAFGSPMGYVASVTSGIISAINRSGGPNSTNINDFLQTDAAINQGNSGGPLVNIYGEVIGVNNWIASSSGGSQGLGFSIAINNVKKSVDDFISYGEIKYGWVGIQLTTLSDNEEYMKDLGINEKNGALVTQVFLGSPGYKGGLRAGDYITKLNGEPVKSYDELVRNVGDLIAGSTAQFTLIRDGKEMNLSVKIEERKESTVSDASKLWPGFTAYPLSEAAIKELKLQSNQKGILVSGISTKSPAVAMGLKNSDVITEVNGKKVNSTKDFFRELANASGEVWFKVLRDGHEVSTVKYKP